MGPATINPPLPRKPLAHAAFFKPYVVQKAERWSDSEATVDLAVEASSDIDEDGFADSLAPVHDTPMAPHPLQARLPTADRDGKVRDAV